MPATPEAASAGAACARSGPKANEVHPGRQRDAPQPLTKLPRSLRLRLWPFLLGKTPLVHRLPFCAHEDELAEANTGVELERNAGHIADLKDLTICDPRLDEGRCDVNHQPEAGKTAAALEEATEIVGQGNAFDRNSVDGGARFQNECVTQRIKGGVVAEIGVIADGNRRGAPIEDTNLVTESEIDRRRPDLVVG